MHCLPLPAAAYIRTSQVLPAVIPARARLRPRLFVSRHATGGDVECGALEAIDTRANSVASVAAREASAELQMFRVEDAKAEQTLLYNLR
jgi:hypothetical protein